MHQPIPIEPTRRAVDSYIADLVARRVDQAHEIGTSYGSLWKRIGEVIAAGGKRIRPHLTIIGYGKLDDAILPIAVAQELIHVAMLIHDDVIDQDFVRHGQQNISGAYQDDYTSYLTQDRATHYAHSAAVLAGDALISEAYKLVAESTFDAELRECISGQLHRSIYEVIGGELMDIEAGFKHDHQFDPVIIYRYKTSSYSFVGPLVSGAVCAGNDERHVKALEEFALNIGIAFQIEDDLLGVFGDESQLGKSTLTDLREGKRTLLIQHHESHMNAAQKQNFTHFGNLDSDVAQLQRIKEDMVQSGARDITRQAADKYFTEAKQALAKLPDSTAKASLEQLTEQLRGRNY